MLGPAPAASVKAATKAIATSSFIGGPPFLTGTRYAILAALDIAISAATTFWLTKSLNALPMGSLNAR